MLFGSPKSRRSCGYSQEQMSLGVLLECQQVGEQGFDISIGELLFEIWRHQIGKTFGDFRLRLQDRLAQDLARIRALAGCARRDSS